MVCQLSAISLERCPPESLEQGLPGCPRGALAPGVQPGAEGVLDVVVGGRSSLVHGGGGAWRRYAAAVGKAGPKRCAGGLPGMPSGLGLGPSQRLALQRQGV